MKAESVQPKKVLVVAPHPDDETLGCGGTLLKWKAAGVNVHWLIVTNMQASSGFSESQIGERAKQVAKVAQRFGFDSYSHFDYPTALLDTLPKGDIVGAISAVVSKIEPDTVLLPYRNDVHSDHSVVFDATVSATKTFRAATVKAIYAYETPSETEFSLRPDDPGFRPNLFICIEDLLEQKLSIMAEYKGEVGDFPFPRSERYVRALATLRGGQAGCCAAEGFMILKEIR